MGTSYYNDLVLTQRIAGNFRGYVGRTRLDREEPAALFPSFVDRYVVVDCADTDEDGSLDLTDDTPLGVPPDFTGAGQVVGEVGRAISPVTVGVSPACRNFTAIGLPPGLAINLTSGVISGAPRAAGIYSFSVTARVKAGLAPATNTFTAWVGGAAQILPFTDNFSALVPNRYLFSSTQALPRMVVTNGLLEYRSTNPPQNTAWATPSLLLPLTNSWDLQVDARVPTNWPSGDAKVGVSLLKEVPGGTFSDILPNRINLKFAISSTEGNRFQYHYHVDGAETTGNDLAVTNTGLARLRFLFHGGTRKLTLWAASYNGTNLSPWIQLGEESLAATNGLGQQWGLQSTNRLRLALWGETDSDDGNTNGARRMCLDNLAIFPVTPPRITGATNFIGQVGVAFSNRVRATNGQTYFTASNLPADLVLDETSGAISGIPQLAGRFTNVVVGVGNPAAASSNTASFTILPAFTSTNAVTGFVNDGGFSHQVEIGTTNFGSNLKFSAIGLPKGTAIDAISGVISGRPTVAGTFPATVTITAFGASANQRVDFTIHGAAGGTFSLTLNPRPTNVLNLPAGLTYAPRTGVISGRPQGWGSSAATGQLSNGATTNIEIAIMPSVPVIAGPTNWNAQVGQETRYQIVAGGFGREWAGFDDFSANTAKWRKSPKDMENLDLWPRANSLVATNGTLQYLCRSNDRVYWSYLLWNRDLPLSANWLALVRAKISTNLVLDGSAVRVGLRVAKVERVASNFLEGNLYRNSLDGSNSVFSADAEEEAWLGFRNEAATGRIFFEATTSDRDSPLAALGTNEISSLGLTSTNSIRLAVGGLSEWNLVAPEEVSLDDFFLLPDPDDIEYQAFLVDAVGNPMTNNLGEPYLPEGLRCDPLTGRVGGVVGTNFPSGKYSIRVEAAYLTNNLPIQGLPSVRGGTNVTLTLLPAFTAINAATFLLSASNRTHTVGVGSNSFGSGLRFTATGLPTGLTINATSGVIAGRPTAAGTFSTRVTITAGTARAFQDLLLSVHNGEGNFWAVGSPVSYQVNLGSGATGYQATGLPTGLRINASGLISGTPRQAGEFTVTVSAPSRGLSTMIPFFIRPIYVNVAATGANNGISWANAYTNLQTAIDAAGLGAQIWVAAGTYKPTKYLDPKVTNDLRSRSFLLKGGVSVLGGFAGTETRLTQQNVEENETILSGDFNGNDSNTWPPVTDNEVSWNEAKVDSTRDENAYHVVGVLSQTMAPVLDGFTITGGNANNTNYAQPNNGFVIPAGIKLHSTASAIAVVNSDLLLQNSHVIRNVGKGGAGGIYNLTGQLRRVRIGGTVFEENLAYYGNGAGFEVQVSQAQSVASRPFLQVNVVRSLFLENESWTGPDENVPLDNFPDGGDGGAVYLYWGVEGNFANCAFIRNYAKGKKANGLPWYDTSSGGREGNGGAIHANRTCDLNIANTIFAENLCDDTGGAIEIINGVRLKMYFSTFFGNDSTGNGRDFDAGVVAGWYGANSSRPNSMTGHGVVAWQNPPATQEVYLWQGDYGPEPTYTPPPLPARSTLTQSTFSTATSLNHNITNPGAGLQFGNPNFTDTNDIPGGDGLYFTEDDGLRIRAGSIAHNLVTNTLPNDFADLDEDGNTTEPLPYDAAGVLFAPNPPYNPGAYQTVAP